MQSCVVVRTPVTLHDLRLPHLGPTAEQSSSDCSRARSVGHLAEVLGRMFECCTTRAELSGVTYLSHN